MPCYHPIYGRRGPGGKLTISRLGPAFNGLSVPCGQCWGCRLDNSRTWATRITHEAQSYDRNSFLTLTYSEANLPKDGSINVRHWQLFAKKLRHYLVNSHLQQPLDNPDPTTLRFFHCGEYSEPPKNRPHYHAAIFGLDWSQDRQVYRKTKNGDSIYTSKSLDALWAHGQVFIGSLEWNSAAYIARYIMKKIGGADAKNHYNGRKPEYITMSRRPGIGHNWIHKYWKDVYPADEIVSNEIRCKPPKYYDQQLEIINPELFLEVKQSRLVEQKKHEWNQTPARLLVREICSKSKARHLQRE